MGEEFKYLFTPLKIGPVTIRNRIVSSPHGTMLGDENLMPSERQAYYHAERAKGGIGLIVVGMGFTHPTSICLPGIHNASDERAIPGLQKIAEMVHEHGTKIFGQLGHTGALWTSELSELPLWAPSTMPYPYVLELAHEMEIEEIEEIAQGFAKAASNYKAAGFDGVELYLSHCRLLGQFLSPFCNKRDDEYGGSLENRLRIIYKVIDQVREVMSQDLVVGVRVSGDEFTDGGLNLDDMREIAQKLEATGKIDYIHVSQSGIMHAYTQVPDMHTPPGAFAYLAAGIKESLKEIPVCTVTRIVDPLQAEKILADGHADMVVMNRATICDPEMPNKAREGRLDDIRSCIGCNQGCIERVIKGYHIRCIQNPAVGKEKELGIGTLVPAKTRKRVLVVGGGPGGMEAARIAALRGHEVTLYEKKDELGGQVAIAAKAPKREEFNGGTRYLSLQIKKLGVKVRLGQEATLETVRQENPDAVVVATGSVPVSPTIPGAQQEHVVEVQDVLQGKVTVGERVLVVDDGEGYWKCCGTAEFLADQGKKVEIVTPCLYIGRGMDEYCLEHLYERLGALKVILTPNRIVKQIQGKTVITVDVYSQEEIRIEGIDTVVLARGYRASNHLYRSLKNEIKELYAIGDCVAPRKVRDAIREGHLVGRML